MDTNNQQYTTPISPINVPPQPPVNGAPQGQSSHRVGPVIGILIIVVLLVLAALYFWGQFKVDETEQATTETENTQLIQKAAVDPAVQNDPESKALDTELNNQLNDIDSLTF